MAVLIAKSVGGTDQHEATINLPPRDESGNDDSIPVREVIAVAVEHYREALRQNREMEAALWRELKRVLGLEAEDPGVSAETQEDISDPPKEAEVLREALAAAWASFEREQYYLIVDGKRMRQLEQRVRVHEDSRITFLRKLDFAAG